MAAAATLLRSVATKMARASPRRLSQHARLPNSAGGLCFSTSTGSAPPPPSFKVSQTHNKKVPNEWDGFKAGIKQAAPQASCFLLFSGFVFFSVNPTLDRIDANNKAESTMLKEIKQDLESTRATIVGYKKEIQTIAARNDVGKQG